MSQLQKIKKCVLTEEEIQVLINNNVLKSIKVNVCYALVNNKYPVEEFVKKLSERDKKKVMKLFVSMMKYGKIENTDNFKRLKRGVHEVLFEFKPNQIIRIGCVRDEGAWLLLIALKKKRDEWVERDFTKFNNHHTDYLNEKNVRKTKKRLK